MKKIDTIEVGQIFKENDSRFIRYVEIVSLEKEYCTVKTIYSAYRGQIITNRKMSKAAKRRFFFERKSKGYTYFAKNINQYNKRILTGK